MFSKLSQWPKLRTGSETHQLNTVSLSQHLNTSGAAWSGLAFAFFCARIWGQAWCKHNADHGSGNKLIKEQGEKEKQCVSGFQRG